MREVRLFSCQLTAVQHRICLSRTKYNGMDKTVWRMRHISINTKVKVFRASPVATLLYSCPGWTLRDGTGEALRRYYEGRVRWLTGTRRVHQRRYGITTAAMLA